MTNVNEKKRKLILVSITFALCVTIMMSGTFAWHSISQYALNETMGEMLNPGGRLHDDFNGSNKDIYVENFTSATDGMPIIVRIRLYEYMGIGADAQTNVPDKSTWTPYVPGARRAEHCNYWDWTLGGKTVYMPTFDKNKDSDYSDINGTYEGTTDGDAIHFDDYQVYQVGDIKSDTASYDADDNHDYDSSITVAAEEHVAKETIAGTVISMAEWAANPVLGDYWVYDTDGWAYWANPLMPDTATGLLLSKIQLNQPMTQKWYYGIYVESQMVTADEVGSETEEVGFYGPDAKKEPSAAARHLLDELIEKIGYTPVSGISIEEEMEESMLSDLEIKGEGLAAGSKSELDEIEEDFTESEEEKQKDEENFEEDENPENETNTDVTPPDETEDEGGEAPENSQDSEGETDENTTPDNTDAGSGETGTTTEGGPTGETGNNSPNPSETPTQPEQSEDANPDNPVTGTDTPAENTEITETSENGDTTPQEPSTEPTGIVEESEDTIEFKNTSQLF